MPQQHSHRSRRALVSVGVTFLLAACGSTAQITSTRQVSSGLGPEGSGTSVVPDGSQAATSAPVASTLGGTGAVGATVGSGQSQGAGSQTSSSTGSQAAAGGVLRPNDVLSIGIVLTSTASVESAGFSSGESYSEQTIDQSRINALNKQGGLVGHRIAPVFASTDPNSNNWGSDFAAACATFTQDHKVRAVLGYQFNYDQNFETCLTNKKVVHLTTGFNIPDQVELARHPLHRALAVPTIDHRTLAKLQGAIDDGVLTSKSKLAIALDGCPGTQSSWNRVAVPFLKAHHITPAAVFAGGACPNGSGDASNGAGEIPSDLLKMRQEGVDRITFLTVSEGPLLAVVAIAAEAQHWNPTYIVSSLGNLSALEGQVPNDQLANVKGYGWMPAQDVGPHLQPAPTSSQRRCIALLKSQKVTLSAFGDFTNAYRMCDALFAYEAALKADGSNTVGTNVISAIDGLGASFNDPDVLDGATQFGPARRNVAPAHVRSIVFKSDCSCFNYVGATRLMP